MTKLFFTPEGRVHRCYKLIRDDSLAGADLGEVSVAAAWHDPGFARLVQPDESACADTSCAGCGRFDKCHGEGRCLFQSFFDHARYHAPDRPCAGPYPVRVLRAMRRHGLDG